MCFFLTMDVKSRCFTLTAASFFLFFSASFLVAFSAANQLLDVKKLITPNTGNARGSLVFRIQGNVYPRGEFAVTLGIGNPPKLFELDVDTGSDVAWVQCDAPCKGCTKPRDQLYKPHGNLVTCGDFLCGAVQSTPNHPCKNPSDQCDYEVEYADGGSSLGVLVRDYFPIRLTNGTALRPFMAFGCGYDLEFKRNPPSTAGVLGLGNGKASILSQLHGQGMISNVVGHCLSGRGGGLIFFGDQLVPSSGIVWTPMLHSSSSNRYIAGPADLFFNRNPTSVKGLQLTFDSGSSYTYLVSQAYKTIVNLITNDLKGKPLTLATGDSLLPICWKGANPFRSLLDVRNYFKPLVFIFTNSRNLQLQVPPEAYLIVSVHGNVCLGILDGTQIGLENVNIIGDITLQDKLVVYDNERQQIGWVSANCDRTSQVMNQSIVISSFTGN